MIGLVSRLLTAVLFTAALAVAEPRTLTGANVSVQLEAVQVSQRGTNLRLAITTSDPLTDAYRVTLRYRREGSGRRDIRSTSTLAFAERQEGFPTLVWFRIGNVEVVDVQVEQLTLEAHTVDTLPTSN